MLKKIVGAAAALALLGGAGVMLRSPYAPEWQALGALMQSPESPPAHKADAHDHHDHAHGPHAHEHEEEHSESAVHMTPAQIEAARITLAPVKGGVIATRLSVPGTIAPDADRLVRVAAKVAGTISELHKRLGDAVQAGETLGAIDSREVADAKSQYLAALLTHDLQQTMFARDKMLWDRKVSTEQAFLRSQAAAQEARIRLDVARQKLFALGLEAAEIEALPQQPAATLRRHELRAPIAGRVIERKVNPGSPVQPESEVFVIADLSKVWLELAVTTADVAAIREGQRVAVLGATGERQAEGRIIFISPLLDPETRSARVVAEIDNAERRWRPGSYVTARITVAEQPADLIVPRSAVQSMSGETVVFVRTQEGFERREVTLGRSDETSVEVVSGLDAGKTVALTNSFILKAELGKSEATHSHAH